ncbi:MAG: RNA methyltransferase [Candidatus Margulisbacteria bacterium]|nr:RNA methyltransferase [Candidatus Margulisiibacteriota bacterium]
MNEKLKLVKNLLEKRSARRKEGKFVIEGPHLIEEAGDKVNFIVYCEKLPIVKKLEEEGVPAIKVSKEQFEEVSGVEAPQGVLGVVKLFDYQFRDVIKEDKTLIVFCVGVQDPGNLGTIIRSADAFGASGVILSKGTVDLYNPKVVRSTMGSLFHLPIFNTEDEVETIEHLKQKNVKIVATTVSARKNCFEAELNKSIAILVGNEGAGLDKEIVKLADEEVKIPMVGKAESLNVGISTAVLLYEALRQHGR